MRFAIDAACVCSTGNLRRNNEDNFFFDDYVLEEKHNGLDAPMTRVFRQKTGQFFAVFDGVGGEHYGEAASHAAAAELRRQQKLGRSLFCGAEQYLLNLTQALNRAVLLVAEQRRVRRIATTVALVYVKGRWAYSCNVGDSRVYCLHDGVLQQLSLDHVSKTAGRSGRKAPLTQCLGMDRDMHIVPHIQRRRICAADRYLICSDGVTDMLPEEQFIGIMQQAQTAESCTEMLLQAVLENGGRDNATLIVCDVRGE